MALQPDGTWDGDRRPLPAAWNLRAHMVAHHIIDRLTLCSFWNRLVEQRAAAIGDDLQLLENAIVQYLEIIGYPGNAQAILHYIQQQNMPADHHSLESALCWQRYNLFEGPTANPEYGRPVHFPDPGADVDSPLGRCASEHVVRVGRLRRASEHMQDFLLGNLAAVGFCLALLQQVRYLDIIRVYDINWYCLMPHPRFTALTLPQRQHFFDGCYFAPGPLPWRKTPQQVEQALANALAAVP